MPWPMSSGPAMRKRRPARERSPAMNQAKTFDEYKAALENMPSQHVREELLAEADTCGFTAWQMAELCMIRAEPWA